MYYGLYCCTMNHNIVLLPNSEVTLSTSVADDGILLILRAKNLVLNMYPYKHVFSWNIYLCVQNVIGLVNILCASKMKVKFSYFSW